MTDGEGRTAEGAGGQGAEGAESAEQTAAREPAARAAAAAKPDAGRAGGGDPSVALRQERERRRTAERINAQLAAKLAEMEQGVPGTAARKPGSAESAGAGADGAGGEELNAAEFAITADELEAGDPGAINAKIAKAVAKATEVAARKAAREVMEQVSASREGETLAQQLLGKFEIFRDADDPDLAEDAARKALATVQALPAGSTFADAEAAVADVAARYSRRKAGVAAGSAGGESRPAGGAGLEDRGLLPAGSGGALAAHFRDDKPIVKESMAACGKDAKTLFERGLRFALRGLGQ